MWASGLPTLRQPAPLPSCLRDLLAESLTPRTYPVPGRLWAGRAPRGDLVEFECDVYGEPVSWLSLDEIDALVYGG